MTALPVLAVLAVRTGYSGRPLAKKLGIHEGCRVVLLAAPAAWADGVAPLPEAVHLQTRLSAQTDLVHLFATQQAELARQLKHLRGSLRPDATLWVSWPKKSAKQATDISEDSIRALALPLGFVDVKGCAVNAVWSGLKLVVRKALR